MGRNRWYNGTYDDIYVDDVVNPFVAISEEDLIPLDEDVTDLPEFQEELESADAVIDENPELFDEPLVGTVEMHYIADAVIDIVDEAAQEQIDRCNERDDDDLVVGQDSSTVAIRRAEMSDVDVVLDIIDYARGLLVTDGIPQWQNAYPSRETILADVECGECYVAVDEEGDIIGTLAVNIGPDDEYERIDGQWLTGGNMNYALIHRCATSYKAARKGVMKKMFAFAEEIAKGCECGSIRMTTHETNVRMRGLAENMGYVMCGCVEISDGAVDDRRRCGYEKIIVDVEPIDIV